MDKEKDININKKRNKDRGIIYYIYKNINGEVLNDDPRGLK